MGSLFRAGTAYDRRDLCVKEKEVPYVVAGWVRDKMTECERRSDYAHPIAGRVRRGSWKGRFRADGIRRRVSDDQSIAGIDGWVKSKIAIGYLNVNQPEEESRLCCESDQPFSSYFLIFLHRVTLEIPSSFAARVWLPL